MLLEKLCNIASPSSYEDDIRNIIKDSIKDFVDEIKVDKMGNIIAHKKGCGKRVILDTFMDEVGFIITAYNEDGTFKFAPIGDVEENSIPCKEVLIGKNKIHGIIGLKAIHLQDKNEREESIDIEKLSIDIGAKSKEEAKSYISIGDYVCFNSKFGYLGENYIKGKALESRVPCFILIELLKEEYPADIYAIFTTQRQIGSRGAVVSSYNIEADTGFIIEGVNVKNGENELEKGVSISTTDSSIICNNDIITDLKKIAERKKISYQIKKHVNKENNGVEYMNSGNVKSINTLSIPCRCVHSAISVASLNDIKNTRELISEYLKIL